MKPSLVAKALAQAITNGHPILLTGKPGVGKTDLVKQAAEACGAELIISHPVVSDPTDYKGMPWVIQVDGKAIANFVPFSDLHRLVTAVKRTIFLLDDLGQAPQTVQAAAMQLILARRLNEVYLSDEVVIFACTNRREDKAGVQGILETVKSRFVSILGVDTDVEDWATWGIKNGIPFLVISFVRWKPAMLMDFKPTFAMTNSPCPRTVTHACKIIKGGYSRDVELEMIQGAVGEAWMIEWEAFRRIEDQLPNVNRILAEPDKAEIPSEPSIMFALCGALAERADKGSFPNIIRYSNRLSKEFTDSKGKRATGRPEFSIMLMKDCILRDSKLRKTKEFISWSLEHKEVILPM